MNPKQKKCAFQLCIAMNLKSIRQREELRQEDVSKTTNIHVGRIESGKANIRISTLYTLANFYNVSIADIFAGVV